MANTEFDAVAGAINSKLTNQMGVLFDKTPGASKDLNEFILPQMFLIGASDASNWSNMPEQTGCTVLVLANANTGTPSRTLQFVLTPTKMYYRMILNGSDARAWITVH